MTEGRTGGGDPLVRLEGITKTFGGVTALDSVHVEVGRAEVLGLVGDNGAGKSTLIKVLSGAYQPDGGRIVFDGEEVAIPNPAVAKSIGIETVYQDLALVDTLDAAGNIFLGRELLRFRLGPVRVLDQVAMRERAEELLDRLGLTLPSLGAEVGGLSGGQRQSVAISRALYTEPKLVILDEPTSALAVKEAERVLELTQNLRDQGISVILISHTLSDVFETTDRIVVLHRGHKVAELTTSETTKEEVVGHILGKDVSGEGSGAYA